MAREPREGRVGYDLPHLPGLWITPQRTTIGFDPTGWAGVATRPNGLVDAMAALLSPGHDDVGDRAAADDLKRPEIIAITTDVALPVQAAVILKTYTSAQAESGAWGCQSPAY